MAPTFADDRIRDPDESDLEASPSRPGSEDNPFSEDWVQELDRGVGDEFYRQDREPLADRIREEYAGQGLVAVDTRNGNVIGIAEDTHELRELLESEPTPPENRLIVRCYE